MCVIITIIVLKITFPIYVIDGSIKLITQSTYKI